MGLEGGAKSMDRALAIVGGTFGFIGLLGFAALLYSNSLSRKIERIRREQHKS
jgi:hypothetical protein